MTTSAVPSTSNRSPHATGTNDGKTDRHAAAGYGGCIEDAGARSVGTGIELPGKARPAGGSAVELARESGAGTAAACRQTQGRVRGGYRLSRFTRAGQER